YSNVYYRSECFDFFFFQAEDGIRDKLVTGVQTCALPISGRFYPSNPAELTALIHKCTAADPRPPANGVVSLGLLPRRIGLFRARSEERRVGKECRSRWLA